MIEIKRLLAQGKYFLRAGLQAALDGGMTKPIGSKKGERAGRGGGNSRNGYLY